MKNKFIKTFHTLLLPISFILILVLLNTVPLTNINKYGSGAIFITIIAFMITFIALKIDQKTFKEIGFYLDRKTPIRFSIGFTLGLIITITMLTIIINFSSIEMIYNQNANLPTILFWLLAFFPLAFMEEIIFRGYAFSKIYKNIGIWPAQILMAILFAWYHDFTGVTLLNQLLGPGTWALIYGVAVVKSKGIALPTGLHMAINAVLAIFGEKDDRHAIWNLEYSTEITPILQSQTENIGIFIQLCILVLGIILTENLRRKSAKNQ